MENLLAIVQKGNDRCCPFSGLWHQHGDHVVRAPVIPNNRAGKSCGLMAGECATVVPGFLGTELLRVVFIGFLLRLVVRFRIIRLYDRGDCYPGTWEICNNIYIRSIIVMICTRRAGKLFRARSRLYRSQNLQVNTRWKALAEVYTMHSFALFFTLNFLFQKIL